MHENLTAIYNQDLEDAPYSISFDREKYVNLLTDLGFPLESLQDLTVEFRDNPMLIRFKRFEGHYDDENKKLSCSFGHIWYEYEETLAIMKAIASHQVNPHMDAFGSFLKTKHLPDYLSKHPQRATLFAQKLLFNALQRHANTFLMHESQHAVDNVKGKMKNWRQQQVGLLIGGYISGGVSGGLLANEVHMNRYLAIVPVFIAGRTAASTLLRYYYNHGPMETSARNAEKLVYKSAKYQNIVRLTPSI